jgi:hypothetical protein
MPATDRAACTQAAVVCCALVEFMRCGKTLHAEQQQQQRDAHDGGQLMVETRHEFQFTASVKLREVSGVVRDMAAVMAGLAATGLSCEYSFAGSQIVTRSLRPNFSDQEYLSCFEMCSKINPWAKLFAW